MPRAESPACRTRGGVVKERKRVWRKKLEGEGTGLLGEDGFGASWFFGGSCGGVGVGGCGLFAGGCRGDAFVVVALLVDVVG